MMGNVILNTAKWSVYFMCLMLFVIGQAKAENKKNEECLDPIEVIKLSLEAVGPSNLSLSFFINERTYFLLFMAKADPNKNATKKGNYTPWRLYEKQGDSSTFCLIGAADYYEKLEGFHQGNPKKKYGMPGSGYQRCSDGNNVLDAMDVRLWANKELGESTILVLKPDIGEKVFTLLISNDSDWIMLSTDKNDSSYTCYYSRGEKTNLYEDQIVSK